MHASHAVNGQHRLLGHLLVKVRSEFAGEDNLILAKLDGQLMPCEVRVVSQGPAHVGMQSSSRFGSAIAVSSVAGFESANLLHGSQFFEGVKPWLEIDRAGSGKSCTKPRRHFYRF